MGTIPEQQIPHQTSQAYIITPYMEKGGVGKTTISALLGFALSALGKVLLIDTDPQGNLTHHFLDKDRFMNEGKQLSDYLTKAKSFEETLIEARPPTENRQGIYILGTETNSNALRDYIQGKFNNDPMRIRVLIKEAKKYGFDFIVFDPPVFFGFYTKTILASSNQVLPVVELEEFGYDALFSLFEAFEEIKTGFDVSFNNNLCIVNKYHKKMAIHKTFLAELQKSPVELHIIPHSDSIPYASAMNIVLQEYKPTSLIVPILDTIATRIHQIKREEGKNGSTKTASI